MLTRWRVNLTYPALSDSARMHWGLRLRQERVARNVTQATLASAAGVTKSAVSQWEAGGNIKPDNLFAVADKLGLSARWLATGRGPASADKCLAAAAIEGELMAAFRSLPTDYREMLLDDARKYLRHAATVKATAITPGET